MTTRSTNTFVIIGAVAVVGCLGFGMLAVPFAIGFRRGFERSRAQSQAVMAAQGDIRPEIPQIGPEASAYEIVELASEALYESDAWSDESLAELLDYYLYTEVDREEESRFFFAYYVLDALDERVDPLLVDILTDAGAREKLSAPLPVRDGGELIHHTPLDRAVALLEPPVPREIAPGLSPMLGYDDPAIRAAGARALGRMVTSAVVAPVRRALDDTDPTVRAAALEGLEWPEAWGHLMGPGSNELFGRLLELSEDDDPPAIAPTVLLGMDPVRAEPLLLADDLTSLIGDERLTHRLAAFDRLRRPIERERLLALISALRTLPPEEPHCSALGHALGILALEGNPRDEAMLRVLASSNHNCHELRAAQALLAVRGLGDIEEVLTERVITEGYRGLTTQETHVIAALDLEMCGRETTLLDTFEIVLAEDWRDGLEGLRAMGATQHALVFEAAIAKFGEAGPSPNQAERTRQVAALRAANAFGKLDAAWRALEEPLHLRIVEYVLANETSFVGLRIGGAPTAESVGEEP